MNEIHPSAIVDPKAELGNDIKIGPFTVIEADTIVHDNVTVGSNCLVAQYTELKKGAALFHGAVVGTVPQDLKFEGEKTTLVIGENTTIREYAMLNRGTLDRGSTIIGDNCLLMAYTHVAHDCLIGNHVIMANAVNLAGHIEIGDYAIIGGVVPVHQFVKIGAHSMIGGGFRVQQDILPYSLVGGYPLKTIGLNKIGLKRRGFSRDVLAELEKCYRILLRSGLNRSQAVEKIKTDVKLIDEVKVILDFIAGSDRGIVI